MRRRLAGRTALGVGLAAALGCAPLAPEPPRADDVPATTAPVRVRVEAGDTLTRIAQQHGVRVGRLARYNELANPDRLAVGATLRIPPPDWQPDGEAPAPVSSAPPRPGALPPGLRRAADQLKRAELALGAGDHRAALALAGAASGALEGEAERPAARDLLARAAFLSGAAHLGLGEADEAACAFARVRSLEPGFEPADGSPAAAVQAYEGSRDELPHAPCPGR